MDWMNLLANAAALAVVMLAPLALPKVQAFIAANIHNKDVALIANATTRAAGRIGLAVAQARLAQPGAPIGSLIQAQLAIEQQNVMSMVKGTVEKLGVTPDTIGKMIEGELGQLLVPSLPQTPPLVVAAQDLARGAL